MQVGMGGSAVKQGAGGYGEKHTGAMETRGVRDQRRVQPPERQRRAGGQIGEVVRDRYSAFLDRS